MKKKSKKRGFTIIELLTVLSIIIILIAMLLPSLNAIRRYAKDVTQKAQFHDIGKGLEMFRIDFEDAYPDSSWHDLEPPDACDIYNGALKLCEAMIGQDGLGFHPDSVFDDMGWDADDVCDLYFNRTPIHDPPLNWEIANLRARKVKYMEGAEIQIAYIDEVYSNIATLPFDDDCAVISDVYKRTELRNIEGDKLGMPVLYYKADSTKLTHDPNDGVTNGTNIYDYTDNEDLLGIDVQWMPAGTKHPLYAGSATPDLFYENTRDRTVTTMNKPHNADSFILISAGWDGLYGTRDDIYNFTKE